MRMYSVEGKLVGVHVCDSAGETVLNNKSQTAARPAASR